MRYTVDYTAEFDLVKQSKFDYLFSSQEVCIETSIYNVM